MNGSPDSTLPSDHQPLPPVLLRGVGTWDAFQVVQEVEGDLGVVLWQSLRNVQLWTSSSPECHQYLFSLEATSRRHEQLTMIAVDPELCGPLAVVAKLLENPVYVERARLTDACFRIAGWAQAHGAPGTALEFMQAGALASPDRAHPAYLFAKAARRQADYPLAESWFARAIHLARRRQEWKVFALAWGGLGNLEVLRGNFPAAKRAHLRAYRAAKRYGLPEVQGDALHDLFGIAIETGATNADHLALAALRAYGWRSPKLPALAHDVAYLWITRGEYARALPVTEALLPHFTCPAERLQALGDVARAAGGAGDGEKFDSTYQAMKRLCTNAESVPAHARAFLDAAYGAANLSRSDLTREIGGRALAAAKQRREGKVILNAEALLATLDTRRSTWRVHSNPGAPTIDSLSVELIGALSRQQAASCLTR